MYLDWQCPNCKEKHLDIIKSTNVLENDEYTIECISCQHRFRLLNISYQIELKCILTDCDGQIKSNSIMNIF